VIIIGNVRESTKFCGRQCESIKKNMKTNASSKEYTKTAANQRKPLKA
jgi:hypothetical protein